MKIDTIQSRQLRMTGKLEGRRMSAALSSAEPVDRVFGTEILEHSEASIDMTRASQGLPLLVNHERSSLPIGRVENVRLGNDQKLRGDMVFSEATEAARDAFALVEDGTLSDVSISYRIMDWERGENDSDEIIVTRWMPLEASVVSVPADGSVGIGRSLEAPESTEVAVMPDNDNTPEAGSASIIDRARERRDAGFAAGAEAERARLNEITSSAAQLARAVPNRSSDIEALSVECREDPSITPDRFRSLAMELIGDGAQAAGLDATVTRAAVERPGNTPRGFAVPGEDSRDKFRSAASDALFARAGGAVDAERMQGNPYRQWSWLDIAETSLRNEGIDTRGLSREQIAKRVIRDGARAIEAGAATYATADFPIITANIASKFLLAAYNETPVTWNQWCSIGSAPDFKSFSIPRLSKFSSLPVVAENAQYQDGTLAEAGETGALVKYGALLSMSWEMIQNDDTSAFARNAASMGQAAARTLDEQVYATLTLNTVGALSGPVMGDTNQLFDGPNHSNVGTAALDLAGIVATRDGIGYQTDENGVILGLDLNYVLVPLSLADEAMNLAQSEYLVDVGGAAQRANTVRSTFEVVKTARLAQGTNEWYGLGARGQTFEVMFLNGQQTPMLEAETGFSYDTMNWKVRHVFDVLPVDWRAMYWNVVA